MPISIEEFQLPSFIRLQEKYPLSYNKLDRYNEIYPPNFEDRYNHNEGESGGFKQAGYNPNHQSTRVERVNLKSETITLKPY
jgi:hypothetical protein